MDSDEKRFGAGSGGDQDPAPATINHSDRVFINGEFDRSAIKSAAIMSTADDDGESNASLIAVGKHGTANVQGQAYVSIITGLIGDSPFQQEPGVQVFCPDWQNQVIQLQLGDFGDGGSKFIRLDKDGITINAGVNGTLELRAGLHSVITLDADGISLKGHLIALN